MKLKTTILVTSTLAMAASFASAAPKHHRKPHAPSLAAMNLTPQKSIVRPVGTTSFAPDTTPTALHYSAAGGQVGGVVGYKPFVDTHPVQSYEVNQATALGFSQSSSTVGASVGVKF